MHNQDSGKFLYRILANGVLAVLILGNLALAVTALVGHGGLPPYPSAMVGLIGVPLVLALLGAGSFFLSASARIVGLNTFFAAMIALYGVEIYLQVSQENVRREFIGNIPPSPIAALRARGTDAYIAWPMSGIDMELTAKDGTEGPIFPFTGPSDSTIVFCNQGRTKWISYQSDQHGFRNAENTWDPGKVQVAIVGDSFTEGYCVSDSATIAGQLRRKFSGVLNLGKSGMGPLKELAVIREYLSTVRPKIVVWLYFEDNDLVDLDDELRIPALVRYLEPAYAQNSILRQAELDTGLKSSINRKIQDADAERANGQDNPGQPAAPPAQGSGLKLWRNVIKLARFRELFGLFLSGPPGNFPMLDQIIRQAKSEVEAWGGRLYFAHLPGPFRYSGFGKRSSLKNIVRAKVMQIVERTGIPATDITEYFDKAALPLGLFQTADSHYNVEGYRITSKAIIQMLNSGERSRPPND